MNDVSNKMKTVWLAGVWLLVASGLAAASDDGAIRMVDVLDRGSGPVTLICNGKPVMQSEGRCGWVSGRYFLKPGKYGLQVVRDGLVAGRCRVTIEAGVILVLIPHVVSLSRPGVLESEWKIRVLKVKMPSEPGVVVFTSLGDEEVVTVSLRDGAGGWSHLAVKRLSASRVNLTQHRGYVPLRFGKRALPSLPVAPGAADLVVLYPGRDGKPQMVNVKEFSGEDPG